MSETIKIDFLRTWISDVRRSPESPDTFLKVLSSNVII